MLPVRKEKIKDLFDNLDSDTIDTIFRVLKIKKV